MRIRLNPDPNGTSGGGGHTAPGNQPGDPVVPQPHADFQRPPATQAAQQQQQQQQQHQQQPPQQTFTVGSDWLKDLQARAQRAAELESTIQQAEAQRQAERDQMLAEQAQNKEAFQQLLNERESNIRQRDEQINALRQSIRDDKIDLAVSSAMAGQSFANDHARQQLAQVLRSRVTVQEREGKYVPISPTGTPAVDYLRGLIESDEFAHFRAPSSRGGSGSTQSAPAPSGDTSGHQDQSIKTLMARMQNRYASTAN